MPRYGAYSCSIVSRERESVASQECIIRDKLMIAEYAPFLTFGASFPSRALTFSSLYNAPRAIIEACERRRAGEFAEDPILVIDCFTLL